MDGQAITEGTVNATGDRIFVDGAWQPYTQRNGVEVNILTSRLNSANEQIANMTGWLRAREATIVDLHRQLAEILHNRPEAWRAMGDILCAASSGAEHRVGLPLP